MCRICCLGVVSGMFCWIVKVGVGNLCSQPGKCSGYSIASCWEAFWLSCMCGLCEIIWEGEVYENCCIGIVRISIRGQCICVLVVFVLD